MMEFCVSNVFRAIAAAAPDRTAIVHRDRRISYAELNEKTDRLANLFLANDIGLHTEREDLENWQSGQDHVAIYMRNCPEYIETLLGAMKARAAGFNVNYRYTHSELAGLMNNAGASAIVYESLFAPQVKALVSERKEGTPYKLLMQVGDSSDADGPEDVSIYETEIAKMKATAPETTPSPDDIFLLFTGGTTGAPKGVLWRQAEMITTLLGSKVQSVEGLVERALSRPAQRFLVLPPFMHGTAQWIVLSALLGGHEVHIQHNTDSFKADEILSQIERDKINLLSIVGDAFGRPICDALGAGNYDISSLKQILNSAAILSPGAKADLLRAAPDASIIDTIGASESGPQAKVITRNETVEGKQPATSEPKFRAGRGTAVIDSTRTRLLAPGHEGEGWLAKTGTIPLGYFDAPEKTASTFINIDGKRYSVPGDRVRLLEDGIIEFCGRDATTINSGGEKIHAEEVEAVILTHPLVQDVIVSSRPSERWGSEVVAVIEARKGQTLVDKDILDVCAEKLARYKLPKVIVYVDAVQRGDNGKPDLNWAKRIAESTV